MERKPCGAPQPSQYRHPIRHTGHLPQLACLHHVPARVGGLMYSGALLLAFLDRLVEAEAGETPMPWYTTPTWVLDLSG
jgi:hypothetical protein